ncbi:PREDICTED: transmembrane protein 14A isoform X2 [Aptenodytes forsteri]|uniref:transmembrane protein 14A isoform X2 n=1 Tax=Aptenodytes forsteri TaxID=9233 RepID=UPI0004F46D9B|nr:PREDICTED: transmembrane protein 14A isoform X2 [Aptenodytes forsteri]
MAIDWIGFAYAALLAVGGVVGYTRKGSKISLAAGLALGSVAGYGAYCVTRDPRNVKISLCKTTPGRRCNSFHDVYSLLFVLHLLPSWAAHSRHRQGWFPRSKRKQGNLWS